MTDEKNSDASTNEPQQIPALFATIHHRSEDRPDGYTADEIDELNRLANDLPLPARKMRRGLWIVGALIVITAVGVAGTPWILIAWDNAKDARQQRELAFANIPTSEPSSLGDTTLPPPPAEDVQAPTYMDVRGLHIGQYREEVAPSIISRGWMIGPDSSPMMELHFAIPRHEAADTMYLDESECREALEKKANQTPGEANSLAGMLLVGCRLAGRVFYDADNVVKAFYVTPAGFNLDRITIEDFAQAIVDNHEVDNLEPQQVRLRTLGFDGYCTDYRGTGLPNVRVNVSNCGFMRVQVETSATSDADFS
ncbi:hypothetical protein [Brevundimonas variabilis]|uniref:Uncharacterized protein n=1 Tax=Brevundimonas variabilis TaxID=74312 RepID=A0A7W9CHC5_9CAUL|nr:hypothetical protein [Brevundimonas variabilis]MBB5745217.1 hypothetical protein [Brevundimonas variabilis]